MEDETPSDTRGARCEEDRQLALVSRARQLDPTTKPFSGSATSTKLEAIKISLFSDPASLAVKDTPYHQAALPQQNLPVTVGPCGVDLPNLILIRLTVELSEQASSCKNFSFRDGPHKQIQFSRNSSAIPESLNVTEIRSIISVNVHEEDILGNELGQTDFGHEISRSRFYSKALPGCKHEPHTTLPLK